MGQASETFGKQCRRTHDAYVVTSTSVYVQTSTPVCVRVRCRAEVSYAKRWNTLGGAAPTD